MTDLADRVTARIGEIRERARVLAQTNSPSWGTVPRIRAVIADALRGAGAVEAALAPHQEHEGRCAHCRESCACMEDALPEGGQMAYAAEVHKAAWDAWANCPHGNTPWPCPDYVAITTALLGEDGEP